MTRYWVSGNSGAGKTTLSRELARRLDVPHIELDGLFHRPGWEQAPLEEFLAAVAERTHSASWVVDGNYRGRLTGELEADVYVWLDYPRRVTFPRVLRRTARRVITRQELWNGNRESWRAVLSRRADTSILVWSWTQHDAYRELFERLADDRWMRLRSPREAQNWLDDVTRRPASPARP